MENLYKVMVALLQRGESFVVATIFDTSGSAPRDAGAKMIVRADGSIIGTIGGGRLEARAIARVTALIPARKTEIQTFDLTSTDAAGSDMICGGRGEVLLDCIDAGDTNNLLIYTEAAAIMEERRKGWLVTLLGTTTEAGGISRQQCLVLPDRTIVGDIVCDPYLLEKLIAGPAKITLHSEAFDEHRFLVDPLRHGGTVYLFGAGHVSQKIAPLSESVGFKTVVLDDRADYANQERFPGPVEIRVIDSFKALPEACAVNVTKVM
jgi:xanthine dehydrogenase accessory factor